AGSGRAFGKEVRVSGVSPDISKVINVKWQAGSPAVPGELEESGAFVSKDYANSHHLRVGSPIAVETTAGEIMHLDVRGIFAPPKGGSPYGDVTISTQRFDAAYQNPQNVYTFLDIAGGATAANTHRLESALAGFPDAKIQTESQFKSSQESGIDTLLNLLYVLLSLSIVVSLFGIVNTLVLTVFERTRELGMLRAVGVSRRQLRRMIRHGSIITALLGASLGIPLGVALALMVGIAINYASLTIPWGTLVVFVIAAVIAGIIAAILPARRAGRLNVLEALQSESPPGRTARPRRGFRRVAAAGGRPGGQRSRGSAGRDPCDASLAGRGRGRGRGRCRGRLGTRCAVRRFASDVRVDPDGRSDADEGPEHCRRRETTPRPRAWRGPPPRRGEGQEEQRFPGQHGVAGCASETRARPDHTSGGGLAVHPGLTRRSSCGDVSAEQPALGRQSRFPSSRCRPGRRRVVARPIPARQIDAVCQGLDLGVSTLTVAFQPRCHPSREWTAMLRPGPG